MPDGLDTIDKGRSLKFGSGVSARLFKFSKDIVDGHETEGVRYEIGCFKAFYKMRVAQDVCDGAGTLLNNGFNQRIGFRMDP